jgi:ribosomal protein S18 acetylase RimI-like enzyme
VELRSLGLQTELIFHRFDGEVTDRGDYLLIRTPSNPNYHWGNMLMFAGPPRPGDFRRWEELFRAELGDMPHRVFGWDMPPLESAAPGPAPGDMADELLLGEVAPFLEAGFRLERTVVLTAGAVRGPPRPNSEVEVRPLRTAREWDEALELGVTCRDARYGEAGYRTYLAPKMQTYRRMQGSARGSWFGAFVDGRMVADLGIFGEGGVARFQSVKTHPDFRRRGICGTLVAAAGRYGLAELGARKLVMLADPGYHAAGIYESVGFQQTELVAGVARP